MYRLFYTPSQVGLSKVEAARLTLQSINPNTVIEAHNGNVTVGGNQNFIQNKLDSYDHLVNNVLKGGLGDSQRCSLVLSCVDNYAARMAINKVIF